MTIICHWYLSIVKGVRFTLKSTRYQVLLGISFPFSIFVFVLLKIGSHIITQASLELTLLLWLSSNSQWSSCLIFPNTGITGGEPHSQTSCFLQIPLWLIRMLWSYPFKKGPEYLLSRTQPAVPSLHASLCHFLFSGALPSEERHESAQINPHRETVSDT